MIALHHSHRPWPATVAALCIFLPSVASSWQMDTSLTAADASFIGPTAGSSVGNSLSSAGDVDGDGFDDILVGTGNNAGYGWTYLVLGAAGGWSMDLDLANADASYRGEPYGDRAGYVVSGVGDVDGDEYDDFIVGAYLNNDGGHWAGASYLVLGRASGWATNVQLSSSADASFLGEHEEDRLGAALSAAGDVNGDGLDDFLLGAYESDEGGINAGQTYLLFGSEYGWNLNTDVASAAGASFHGATYDNAGSTLSGAGDVNGDGYSDFLVGASNNNVVYLVTGRATGWSMETALATDATAAFGGEAGSDYAGAGIAAAGDANGDGLDDIIIGAYGNDEAGSAAGQAYLILGRETGWNLSMSLSNATASFLGEATNDNAGFSVAGVGDVDGDGFDDLLIGAAQNDESNLQAGQSYLVFGRDSGWAQDTPLGSVDASFRGEWEYDASGRTVAGAGDVNGDGGPDFLVAAYWNDEGGSEAGQAYLYFGDPPTCFDDDGDGYGVPGVVTCPNGEEEDCNDGDPLAYPGAAELCDAQDNNCDGVVPADEVDADGDGFLICENDCNDADAGVNPAEVEEACNYIDDDCDGAFHSEEVDNDGDGYNECQGDCDDSDANVYPGADESCNGADDDCDGTVDEDDAVDVLAWHEDNDGDGFGNALVVDIDCSQPAGYVADATDCDDTDPDVNPDETETTCDGVDNDCDPATEDEPDNDGDGYSECDDCDDGDADVNPGITYDECTGVDNDCNGAVDDGDLDGDGWTVCDDCDDDDVDLTWDDLDGDGWSTCAGDCDDGDAQLNLADLDGDGWDTCAGECDDTDADRYPGAQELCDAVDNDCDGVIPEDEVDDDGDDYMVCGGDCDDDEPAFYPGAPELCDALDNDCDGTIPADEVDDDGDGYLACEECDDDDALLNLDDFDGDGYSTCDGDADDADPTVFPGAEELCDGLDNDCDGVVPADEADADGDGFMLCEGDLDDNDPTVYPTAPELHDGLDNDCDGLVDEGMLPANALIITEIMRDPSLVDDTSGEWFEVYNNTAQEMNLYGMEVEDLGTNSFVVASDVWVLPYEHAMLGRDDDPDLNGGVDLDYEYGTLFSLANTDDEIIITFDGEELDRVEFWDPDWPDVSGEAMSLDPSAYDTALNDDPASWCSAQDAYGDGDLGTPGLENPICCPDQDGDGYLDVLCGGDDCDDADDAVHPGVPELACDYIDNNCDGIFHPHEVDDDGDGFDECGPDLMVGTGDDDCDDTDPDVNPGETEITCDGLDNDCDEMTEDEPDGDGDGYSVCLDCDDNDGGVHPAATELACDHIDNNCDGSLHAEEADDDGDGFDECGGDCDDADPAVSPAAVEAYCDFIDNDCDGGLHPNEVDDDGDGWNECIGDPDDSDPTVYPGATELACDYLDNDGDGQLHPDEVDDDLDGYDECSGDCVDSDPAINPDAIETACDSTDNDCDGVLHPEEMDDDDDGVDECHGDCDDADASRHPAADEYCDGVDNDCDGQTDEDDALDILTWYQDLDGDGFGNPAATDLDCTQPPAFVGNDEDCDDLDFYVHPGAVEVCNGVDDDCDPATDETDDLDSDGFTLCDGECDDADPDVNPGAPEECDGVDNDCDETTDEEVDGDGDTYTVCDGDCDDTESAANPAQYEDCFDSIDNDCDGLVDLADDECAGDDDDSAGDDDDSSGDDDDSAGDDDDTTADDDDMADDDDNTTGDDDDAVGDDDTSDDDAAASDDDSGDEGGCECRNSSTPSFPKAPAIMLTLLGVAALRRRRA